jgi:hypothetical protein
MCFNGFHQRALSADVRRGTAHSASTGNGVEFSTTHQWESECSQLSSPDRRLIDHPLTDLFCLFVCLFFCFGNYFTYLTFVRQKKMTMPKDPREEVEKVLQSKH